MKGFTRYDKFAIFITFFIVFFSLNTFSSLNKLPIILDEGVQSDRKSYFSGERKFTWPLVMGKYYSHTHVCQSMSMQEIVSTGKEVDSGLPYFFMHIYYCINCPSPTP